MKLKVLFYPLTICFLISCNSSPRRNTYDYTSTKSAESSNTQSYTNQTSNESNNQASQPKKWRQDLPGGGYADYIQHEDGSLTVTQVQPCMFCHGTKICPACGGAGGTYGRAYGGMYYPCQMCLQTGKCSSCKGEGSVTTISITDAAGNTHMTSSNGYSAVGGPGGTIVTDPNGRRTGHPSGGGVSRSSSISSQRDRSNDYIETIEYAPNYTGESNDEWCEKCQKISPRHSHIRKRVY